MTVRCLVRGGDPITVIVVHINKFGFAITIKVQKVANPMLVVIEITVGGEWNGASFLIKEEAINMSRRSETAAARSTNKNEVRSSVMIQVSGICEIRIKGFAANGGGPCFPKFVLSGQHQIVLVIHSDGGARRARGEILNQIIVSELAAEFYRERF